MALCYPAIFILYTMLTATYQNSFCQQLGRILLSKEPAIAQALISEYLPARSKPIETDLTKIPDYFTSFCELQQINPEDYTGALYKSSKIDKRRLFVAVIILMYHRRTKLVAKCISETVGQDPAMTTRMIQEVEFRYSKVDEFKSQVDEVVKLLTKDLK